MTLSCQGTNLGPVVGALEKMLRSVVGVEVRKDGSVLGGEERPCSPRRVPFVGAWRVGNALGTRVLRVCLPWVRQALSSLSVVRPSVCASAGRPYGRSGR